MVMYIVAPDKYLIAALLDGNLMHPVLGFLVLLDLCGICGLGAGVGIGSLPVALAVGYAVSACGAVFAMGVFEHFNTQGGLQGYFFFAVVVVAFVIPFLLARFPESEDDIVLAISIWLLVLCCAIPICVGSGAITR